MQPKTVAVVGAAETTKLGVIPDMSQIQLHADAALNAMADAGLKPTDIDGVATAGETPMQIAHYLGITPTWVDGTSVGGCSFMIHVRHAAAAIDAGLCDTVLITHGESGRSGRRAHPRRRARRPAWPASSSSPTGRWGRRPCSPIPVLRYMKTYGVTEETWRWSAVVQREWAGKNPRATFQDPITVDDVLNSRMIAYPFRLLMCCLVTDGGGALILTAAERAKEFPTQAGLHPGHRRERRDADGQPDGGLHLVARVPRVGPKAFAEAGISHSDVDHLMIYDAFAHLPIYGLEDLGLCPARRGGRVHRRAQHGARRQAAAEHQRRRALLHALRACTACTRCRRACGRCAASRRRRSRARRSRSATASAACSPPPARSSSRTSRRRGDSPRHYRCRRPRDVTTTAGQPTRDMARSSSTMAATRTIKPQTIPEPRNSRRPFAFIIPY